MRTATTIRLAALAALLLPALASPAAHAQEGGTWLTDQNSKCRLWWPSESQGEEDRYAYSGLHWNGPCRNGLANGHGRFDFAVVWRFADQAPVASVQSGEGDFAGGKLAGRGFTVRKGPVYTSRREGEWRDGVLNGRGVESSESATSFARSEGTFANGKLNGPGVSNNEEWKGATRERAYFFRYEGDYANGQQEGRGLYVRGRKGCALQIKYEGEYRGGRMNGRGTFTTKDGRTHAGMVNDGDLVGTNIGIFELVADIDRSCP